jgi:hypothetical protein
MTAIEDTDILEVSTPEVEDVERIDTDALRDRESNDLRSRDLSILRSLDLALSCARHHRVMTGEAEGADQEMVRSRDRSSQDLQIRIT